LEDIFNFQYALECYQPKKNRRYGYYCLPILFGSRFVGRIDPKTDRKANILIIKNLHFEDKNILEKGFFHAFSHELRGFAAFNGCRHVAFSDSIPAQLRRALKPHF
jgi:uncharacterized protein YcaQ